MGVVSWAGALIMGVFVYIGCRYLFNTIVTGTTTGEVLLTNVLPIALACVVLVVLIGVFKA